MFNQNSFEIMLKTISYANNHSVHVSKIFAPNNEEVKWRSAQINTFKQKMSDSLTILVLILRVDQSSSLTKIIMANVHFAKIVRECMK